MCQYQGSSNLRRTGLGAELQYSMWYLQAPWNGKLWNLRWYFAKCLLVFRGDKNTFASNLIDFYRFYVHFYILPWSFWLLKQLLNETQVYTWDTDLCLFCKAFFIPIPELTCLWSQSLHIQGMSGHWSFSQLFLCYPSTHPRWSDFPNTPLKVCSASLLPSEQVCAGEGSDRSTLSSYNLCLELQISRCVFMAALRLMRSAEQVKRSLSLSPEMCPLNLSLHLSGFPSTQN